MMLMVCIVNVVVDVPRILDVYSRMTRYSISVELMRAENMLFHLDAVFSLTKRNVWILESRFSFSSNKRANKPDEPTKRMGQPPSQSVLARMYK